MFDRLLQRILTRLFAEVRQQGDVAAHQSLQTRSDRAEDRAGTNYDSAHDPEIFNDSETFELECGGNQCRIHDAESVPALTGLAPDFAKAWVRAVLRAGSVSARSHPCRTNPRCRRSSRRPCSR